MSRSSQRSLRNVGRGLSTVEVLIGVGILTLGLAGLASTLPTAERSVHLGGQNSKATALAQQMLETIRNDVFSQLTAYNGLDGNGVDTRVPSNFPVDIPNPPIPGNPGNFQGGTNLTRWTNDIALFLTTGAGITGGYGTVVVESVAQDPPGSTNSILDKVRVSVFWTESGVARSVQYATLVSGI